MSINKDDLNDIEPFDLDDVFADLHPGCKHGCENEVREGQYLCDECIAELEESRAAAPQLRRRASA